MNNPLENKDILGLIWKRAHNEADIIALCDSNPENYKKLCRPEKLREFLEDKYPGISKYKPKDKSWRDFFLILAYYKGKLFEEFGYTYKGGDFETQYSIFKNSTNWYGRLIKAIDHNEYDVAKFIIDKDRSIITTTLIDAAIENQNFPIFKLLIDNTNEENMYFIDDFLNETLARAARHGNLEMLKYLIEKKGADLHAEDEKALRVASQNGHLDVVKYLVERGADVHAMFEGALRFAAARGQQHVVNYLLSKGADPNALDEDIQADMPAPQQHVYYDE